MTLYDFFIGKMSKTLNKCIIALGYAGNTLLVLLDASSDASLRSFTAVIGTPVGIVLLLL